jgi:hypothetical protein
MEKGSAYLIAGGFAGIRPYPEREGSQADLGHYPLFYLQNT